MGLAAILFNGAESSEQIINISSREGSEGPIVTLPHKVNNSIKFYKELLTFWAKVMRMWNLVKIGQAVSDMVRLHDFIHVHVEL